jgi:hypothetical protein
MRFWYRTLGKTAVIWNAFTHGPWKPLFCFIFSLNEATVSLPPKWLPTIAMLVSRQPNLPIVSVLPKPMMLFSQRGSF